MEGFLFKVSVDQVSKLKTGLAQTQVGKKADEKDLQDLVGYNAHGSRAPNKGDY